MPQVLKITQELGLSPKFIYQASKFIIHQNKTMCVYEHISRAFVSSGLMQQLKFDCLVSKNAVSIVFHDNKPYVQKQFLKVYKPQTLMVDFREPLPTS